MQLTVRNVDFPLILINLKTYQQSTGLKSTEMALIAEDVSKKTGICIAVAPQTIDLRPVTNATSIPIFAQHIDPIEYGKNTGYNLPEAIANAGCSGTLISHSERRLDLNTINDTVKRAREVSLFQVVCVDTIERGACVASCHPDSIAIEPPELIGTGTPVSKAQPGIVEGAVKSAKKIDPTVKVLCGAGITSGEDVSAALSLGAEGILVASGVVKATDPREKILELARAML
jgi:triosephosphate isomerase